MASVPAPETGEGGDCSGGGLLWVSFEHRGQTQTLGFEGGVVSGQPCDPARDVARCDDHGTYRIGHYDNTDDYGVLYGSPELFYFVGLRNGVDPPFTTDQLATVAEEIARVVFVD